MRRALRWLLALSVLGLVVPILFYLVTGTIIGLLFPCSTEAGMSVLTYRANAVILGCTAVTQLVKLVVALWGSTIVLGGAFLLAFVEILSDDGTTTRRR